MNSIVSLSIIFFAILITFSILSKKYKHKNYNGGSTKLEKIISWKETIKNWENGIPLEFNYKKFNRFQISPIDFSKKNWGPFIIYYYKDIGLINKKKDYTPFLEYLTSVSKKRSNKITSFTNLNGSCLLVIPPIDNNKDYAFIDRFYKNAGSELIKNLWKKIAYEIKKIKKNKKVGNCELINNKLWISTHGHGVSWLHIRLCNKPQYFLELDKIIHYINKYKQI